MLEEILLIYGAAFCVGFGGYLAFVILRAEPKEPIYRPNLDPRSTLVILKRLDAQQAELKNVQVLTASIVEFHGDPMLFVFLDGQQMAGQIFQGTDRGEQIFLQAQAIYVPGQL